MGLRQVTRQFTNSDELERELEEHLSNGGCFVEGHIDIREGDECALVLVAPGGDRMDLRAVAVWVVDGERPGVGLQLAGFDRDLLDALAAFARTAARAGGGAGVGAAVSDGDRASASDSDGGDHGGVGERRQTPHERLRRLSSAEQHKVAREGEVNERIVLERIYGKAVWDSLLANPRLTPPEVSRIARMGQITRPQLEQITGNAHWLSSPQVRRALLSNRRLTSVMIDKVLRLTPKHELKLMPKQTAYPPEVRAAAQKLIKIS